MQLGAKHCADAEAALMELTRTSDPDRFSRVAAVQYLMKVGDCYRDVKNYKAAERVYVSLAATIEEMEGGTSQSLRPALFYLAQMQAKQGDFQQAEATFEHVMLIEKAGGGRTEGDVTRLHTFPALAEVKMSAGKDTEAAALFKEWFAAARQNLKGPDDLPFGGPEVESHLRSYQDVLARLKQDATATTLAQDIVIIWGPGTAQELYTISTVVELGDRALRSNDAARAEALFSVALNMHPRSGERAPLDLINLRLAEAQLRSGKVKLSQETRIVALGKQAEQFEREAEQFERDRNYGDAVPSREQLATLLDKHAAYPEKQAWNIWCLARDLARVGRIAEADKRFEAWIALTKRIESSEQTARKLAHVAEFYYRDLRNLPVAYTWFKKYITPPDRKDRSSLYDQGGGVLGFDAMHFAETCFRLEKYAEAETFLTAAIGPDPEKTDNCWLLQEYSAVLKALKRTGEAEQMAACARRCVERQPVVGPLDVGRVGRPR